MADPTSSLFGMNPTLQAGTMAMPSAGIQPYDPMITGGFSGGPLAASMFNDYQTAFGNNMRASDLEYANAQNTYQNTMAMNPLLESQRGLIAGDQSIQKYLQDSGLAKGAAVAQVGADTAGNIAKKSAAELQDMNNHLDGMEQIDSYIKARPDFLENKAAQGEVAKLAQKYNVHSLPDTWTKDDVAHVNAMAAMSVNTRQQRQQQQMLNQQYVQKVGTGAAAAGVGEIASAGQWSVAAHLAQAQYASQMQLAQRPVDQQMAIGFLNKLASGATITEGDIRQQEKIIMDQLRSDPTLPDRIKSARSALMSSNEEQLKAMASQYGISTKGVSLGTLRDKIAEQQINDKIQQTADAKIAALMDNHPYNGNDNKQYYFAPVHGQPGRYVPQPTGQPAAPVTMGSGQNMWGGTVGVPGGMGMGTGQVPGIGAQGQPVFGGQPQQQPTPQGVPSGQAAPGVQAAANAPAPAATSVTPTHSAKDTNGNTVLGTVINGKFVPVSQGASPAATPVESTPNPNYGNEGRRSVIPGQKTPTAPIMGQSGLRDLQAEAMQSGRASFNTEQNRIAQIKASPDYQKKLAAVRMAQTAAENSGSAADWALVSKLKSELDKLVSK